MPNELQEQDLQIEMLETGDRPSLFALGLWASKALRLRHSAVFLVDVLGRVHLMPPEAVKVLVAPRVEDELLDSLTPEHAINVMVKQEDTEEQILEYLEKRKARDGTTSL